MIVRTDQSNEAEPVSTGSARSTSQLVDSNNDLSPNAMNTCTRSILVSTGIALSSGLLAVFVVGGLRFGHAADSSEDVAVRRGSPVTPASVSNRGDDGTEVKANPAESLTDVRIESYRTELVDLAFRAASAVPLQPHVKNRSRMQESVVGTCLELGQAKRAYDYAGKIENWRRGTAYADLAMFLAQHDEAAHVQHYLDMANAVSERAEEDGAQDWAKDRIRVKIAGVHAWLGHTEKAIEFATGAVEFEAGKVNAVTAMKIGAGDFDEQTQLLDKQIALGALDTTRNALDAYVQLFNTFYGDAERRAAIQEKIQGSWGKTPVQIRYDVMMQLIGSALSHEDSKTAILLCGKTQELLDGVKWLPEDNIALTARLAAARHRAGDTKQARTDLDAAAALYDKERLNIANVNRGGALRPVAEAYHAIGDTKTALATYRRAVEEGVVNPNSRPRADDLVATCCSMARVGVEPDKELRARLAEIGSKLADPW